LCRGNSLYRGGQLIQGRKRRSLVGGVQHGKLIIFNKGSWLTRGKICHSSLDLNISWQAELEKKGKPELLYCQVDWRGRLGKRRRVVGWQLLARI
jgi:hypothetical protein